MQFYLIAPLIVWMLHKMPVLGLGIFGILHGISAAMRYSATLSNRLSPVIFHGMKYCLFLRFITKIIQYYRILLQIKSILQNS